MLLIASSTQSFAQTTIATTLLNNNGSSIVMGTLFNGNASPIIINSIKCASASTGSQTYQLWTKPVAGYDLGAPGAVSVANGWTMQATNTLSTTADLTNVGAACATVMSGLIVSLAPGYYRFCISATSIRYSTIGTQTCNFSGGGVNIRYCALNGYGGTLASPANTPRGLVGAFTFSASTPCTGTPAPGNTVSTNAAPCAASAFTLSLQNNTTGTGITYQWYANTGAGYSAVAGATNSSLTTTQSVATSYYCNVSCSAGGTGSSTPIALSMTSGLACLNYCASAATSTADEDISNVTFGTLNNSSGCATLAPGPGSVVSMYSNYKSGAGAPAVPSVSQLQSVPFSVTQATCGGAYGNIFGIYIDYNQNGLFTDAGENVFTGPYTTGNHTDAGNITIPISATVGVTGMRVVVVESSVVSPCGTYLWGETEDYLINIVATTACTGTPAASNTVSSAPTACSGTNFTLSLSNGYLAAGYTYQWQSSPNGSSYTNIAGATNSTAAVNQTASTYYQCIITCSNGGSPTTSTPLQVGMNSFVNCYCTPTYVYGTSGSFYGVITNVSLNTLSHSPPALSTQPYYFSNPAVGSATTALVPGQTYTLSITSGAYNGIGVWIDFNQSGTYQASEFFSISGNNNSSGGSWTGTASVTVPLTAVSGLTGMRVSSTYYCCYPLPIAATDGCGNGWSYGETEDYKVTVVPLPATPSVPIEIGTPDCIAGGTINPNGTAPGGETWYWQSAAAGTSTANPASGNYNILANGTYYLRSQSNTYLTWSTNASSIVVSDFPAGPANPSATAPGGNPACGAVTLVSSVAPVGTTNYWQGTNATGTSTASIADDGSTNTPYPAPSNATFYVRGRYNTTGCWSNPVGVAVTIYALPTAPVLTATPTSICPGASTALSAVAPSAPPTGYSVAALSYATMPSPETTTLAGAGPIGDEGTVVANIGFNFNFYGTTYSQVQIHTNGFIVFGSANYVFGGYSPTGNIPTTTATNNWFGHWADLNASAGQITYATQGVSPNRKFIVNYNHDQYYSATPYISLQLVVNEADGSMDIYITHMQTTYTSAIGCENLGGTLGTAAPGHNNVAVAADNEAWHFAPIQAMGFAWSGNTAGNGGITSGNEVLANTSASPSASTVYTMTLTEPAHNCQSSNTVSVSIQPVPPAPTGTGGATACGTGTVVLSATGTGGTLQWYRVATGGTMLGTGGSFTTPNAINADSTFYVEETNGTCTGPRAAVVAVYTIAPTVSVSSSNTSLCNPGSAGTTLNATGGDPAYVYSWSPAPVSTSGTYNENALVNPSATTTYILTGTNSGSGCSAQSSITITVAATPVISSVTATPATICSGGTSQLVALAAGGAGGAQPGGYCTPGTTSNTASDQILNVTFAGINNTTGVGSAGGYDNFSSTVNSATVNLGTSYSLNLTINNGGTEFGGVWIDFNRNGTFDASEFTNMGSGANPTVLTQSILVPLSASPGHTRMRVRSKYGSTLASTDPCAAYTWGETEDYDVNIIGGVGFTYAWTGAAVSNSAIFNPTATLSGSSATYYVTVTNGVCSANSSVTLSEPVSNPGNTNSTLSTACPAASFTLSMANPPVGSTFQWQSSPNGTTWTNIGGATNVTHTTTQSAATYYRCGAGCVGNLVYSNSTQVLTTPFYNCYCASAATTTADEEIYSITVNGASTPAAYSGTNGCTTAAPGPGSLLSQYSNFSTLGPLSSMLLGATVPFDISEDECDGATYYACGISIWIDYNQNGSFTDAGEQVFVESATAAGPRHATGSFVIPATATPGLTAMRVTAAEGYSGASLTPCLSYGYGETEDWVVAIAAPNATSNSPVCQGSTLNLFSPTTGTSYSWTTTAANAFTSSVKDPVLPNAGTDAAGIYTVHITFGGGSFVDASVTVVINPSPVVAPTASAAFCEGTAALDLHANAPTGVSYLWTKIVGGVYSSTSSDPSIAAAPASASGTYKVRVTDANGCRDSANVVALVYALPPVAITVIGSNNLCTGQTTSDLQGTGVPASGYSWSTTETTDLITVSTGGTYTLTGTDVHGCINTDVVVITESAAPAAPIVTPAGPINLCSSDGGATYSSATLTVTNYGTDLLWSTSETTTSITVDYGDIFNVTYTDPAGCYSVSNPVVTNALLASSDPASATSNITTNNVNNICLGNNVILTVNGGSLGDNATWHWYEGTGACGTGTARGIGSSVTITPSTTGVHHYTVRAEGTCNNTACASIDIIVSAAPPSGTISVTAAPVTGCNGTVSLVSVNAVSGATYYSWNGTSGALYSSSNVGPFVAGPYQTSGPSVYVQFLNPAPAGNSGYNICCFAANACGQSNTICTWVRSKVSQPGVISGGLIACASSSSAYSIAPVTGANTYTWTITGNANINGGGTTLTTASPSITVNFLGLWSSGTLSVYASLTCGFNSVSRNLNIVNTPAIPGTMTGPGYVCPSGSSSFSVSAVPGAASYNWTTNVPGAVISPAGNTASIAFPAVIPAGSLVCVTSISSCGFASPQRCKSIASGIPNIPGVISGPTTGQCGQSGVSYSITPVFGATSYLWSSSSTQATISGPNNLSAASVNFTSTFSSVTINVVANSACGSSAPRTLSVNGFPGLPAVITGNAAPCAGTVQSYTTGGASGATSYNWTWPAGTTLVGGQNSNNLLVLIGSTAGNIAVTASNDCGVSGTRTFAITIPCRQGQVEASAGSTSTSLYPNPTSGKTTVKFESVNSAKYVISVVDVTGRVIISDEVSAAEGINMHELDLTKVAKGIYLVRMETAGEQAQLLKVTVE